MIFRRHYQRHCMKQTAVVLAAYVVILLLLIGFSAIPVCAALLAVVALHWAVFAVLRTWNWPGLIRSGAGANVTARENITSQYFRCAFFRDRPDPTDDYLVDYMLGFKRHAVGKVALLYSPEEYTRTSLEKNPDYEADLRALFGLLGRTMPARLPIDMGDVMYLDDSLVLSKSRAVGGCQTVLPLDMRRHAGFMQKVLEKRVGEVPYERKKDLLVWRGGTNGMTVWANTNRFMNDAVFQKQKDVGGWWEIHKNPARTHLNGRGCLVDRYGEASWCDIGFSKNTCGIIRKLKPYIRESDWVNHKVLLCMEGNDVASSLRWMMAADSVVLMPAPTCETCFCEGLLRPWVHYVPLNDDLSDVKEKYEWILQNPKYAQNIRQRSRDWALRFSFSEQRRFGARVLSLALSEMRRLQDVTRVQRQTIAQSL